jgi:putative tricarboxylic transport membrane protein
MSISPRAWVGVGTLAAAGALAAGASQVHGDAGYAGVGPAFLPWLVSAALAACGALLIVEGMRSPVPAGVATAPPDAPAAQADWISVAWISAGLLLNAALINRVGFIVSCAGLFALAAHGFRRSMRQPAGVGRFGRDLLVGLAISAPVYWLFTKALGLTLPGLTKTGWI